MAWDAIGSRFRVPCSLFLGFEQEGGVLSFSPRLLSSFHLGSHSSRLRPAPAGGMSSPGKPGTGNQKPGTRTATLSATVSVEEGF